MVLKWALLSAAMLTIACSDIPDDTTQDVGPDADIDVDADEGKTPERQAWTQAQKFYVTYERVGGSEEPLPFQEVFALRVRVFADDSMSEPLGGASVGFNARVEQFFAPMTTRPTVREERFGEYLIDGLLFHVPLRWQLLVDIEHAGASDQARFLSEQVGIVDGEVTVDPTGQFNEEELRQILTLSPEGPLPADTTNAVADDPQAAHLGQFLFFDTRFSESGTIACASCHQPDHGFSDPDRLSFGEGETGRRSMPALHSGFQRWFFWDGRTDSMWSQALQPLESPVEHGTNRMRVAHAIAADAQLKQAYEAIFEPLPDLDDRDRFPDDARPVADDPEHPHHVAWMAMSEADREAVNRIFSNFGKAIAAYERRLVAYNSPFDTFVEGLRQGDAEAIAAISEEARAGVQLFVGKGNCVFCHSGPEMSNFEFHNLGMERRSWMPDAEDSGRIGGIASLLANPFNAAGVFSDDPTGSKARHLELLDPESYEAVGAFKTPGLRNVALRAPYMHGGHMQTLAAVMDFYSDMQEDAPVGSRDPLLQPTNLSNTEIAQLVAMMEALTGQGLDESLLRQPDSPLSGD